MPAILVLEDGSLFPGVSVAAEGERVGEVAFDTAVVGYEGMVTDPSNAGKILVLTYPLIGNYGIANKFLESQRCFVGALAIKEKSRIFSNWQAEDSLESFMKKENAIVISGIDTRTLAVKIRDKGEMLGMVSTMGSDKAALMKRLKEHKKRFKKDHIRLISVKKATRLEGACGGPRIAIIELGILNGFVRQLKSLKCDITLLPYNTSADMILGSKFDGLIISNGPEADAALPGVVKTVKGVLGKLPVLGISLGHEIICLALGGKISRMKVGHHGVNYPVKFPSSYKGVITVQNHSYVVDEKSLKGKRSVKITSRNINDNTVEGMESARLKFISTQYYPLSPGFDEVSEVFKRFVAITRKERTF